jgi:hypothetical protein
MADNKKLLQQAELAEKGNSPETYLAGLLRSCADAEPGPLNPHWTDEAKRLMRWAADALWAADVALDDYRRKLKQQAEPVRTRAEAMQDMVATSERAWLYELTAEPVQRKPLTDKEMRHLWSLYGYKSALCMRFARAIEAAHGITGGDDE